MTRSGFATLLILSAGFSFAAGFLASDATRPELTAILAENTSLRAERDASLAKLAVVEREAYGSTYVRVEKLVDGDTIEVTGGTKVRYLGIDTPETVSQTKGVQPWGPEAKARNAELTSGRILHLVRGIDDADNFGRKLRYVWALDAVCQDPASAAECEGRTGSGTWVQETLLREGLARAYFPTSSSRREPLRPELEEIQGVAQAGKVGLWAEARDPFTVTKENPTGESWK